MKEEKDMYERHGYSAALILSEGRYERRMRHQEFPSIEIELLKKSNWVRVNDLIVKRLAALKPVEEN